MQNLSNEKLCVKAQKGDATAVELLLENNMGFIRRTAHEVYEAMNLNGSGLGIDFDDLVQEGSIGLLKTIPHFEPDREMKFLTYAGKAVKNAMTDLVRQAFSQYEQRVTRSEEQYPLKRVYLDDIVFGDERLQRIEAVVNPLAKTPEQNYLDKEQMEELYAALERLTPREQSYLLYRYGFTDDIEHPLVGTAIHFRLSKSRAKKTELIAQQKLISILCYHSDCNNY